MDCERYAVAFLSINIATICFGPRPWNIRWHPCLKWRTNEIHQLCIGIDGVYSFDVGCCVDFGSR